MINRVSQYNRSVSVSDPPPRVHGMAIGVGVVKLRANQPGVEVTPDARASAAGGG